jgi:hypothetical protein
MDTAAASTPEYFSTTFGVSPEVAADLSQQAKALSGTLGPEAQALQRHTLAQPVAPPPPAPPPHEPTAVEMSQRAQEHSEAQANDAFAQHYAVPQDPSGYEFPRAPHSPTDEDIALDNSIKSALHAEQIPAGLVRHVLSDLNEAVHSQARETEAQRDARLDSTVSRLESMWQKSGEGTFEENMAIIRSTLQGIKSPEIRRLIEINSQRFSPLAWDALLQFSKYRANKR